MSYDSTDHSQYIISSSQDTQWPVCFLNLRTRLLYMSLNKVSEPCHFLLSRVYQEERRAPQPPLSGCCIIRTHLTNTFFYFISLRGKTEAQHYWAFLGNNVHSGKGRWQAWSNTAIWAAARCGQNMSGVLGEAAAAVPDVHLKLKNPANQRTSKKRANDTVSSSLRVGCSVHVSIECLVVLGSRWEWSVRAAACPSLGLYNRVTLLLERVPGPLV